MKKVLIVFVIMFSFVSTASAANGDLIVGGNLTVNGTTFLGSLSADPVCTTGAVYFNTSSNVFRACSSGVWKSFASSVKGYVGADGSMKSGSGFTSALDYGGFHITFAKAFSAPPYVQVTPADNGQNSLSVYNITTTGFYVSPISTPDGYDQDGNMIFASVNNSGFTFKAEPY